jgi:molybdopterin biosynthesis enzyme MoaB
VSGQDVSPLRCLVATVALGRASVRDDVTQVAIYEVEAAGFQVVRSVTVNREKEFIVQLLSNVATGNEADASILIGGDGIGPRDYACEAVDELTDHRIEGFGEEYRRVLREGDDGSLVTAVLTRASAGVYGQCVVIALPRQAASVLRRAMQELVVPLLPQAVRIATGIGREQASR